MNFLCRLIHCLCAKPKVYFTIRYEGILISGRIKKMELREGQKSTLTVNLTTAAGHPAAYQAGTASFESSDPSVVAIASSSTNELEAEITGVDGSNNAAAIITFRCDGDPDADQTRDIVATLDVVCTQGEAFVAEIAASTPTDV